VPDADLVILGAGPAGLGAAWRASLLGHRVVVVERAARPGGAAGSFEVDGLRVDHGSHRLHPSIEPRILDSLRWLLGGQLQRRPRNGRIWLGGRWIRFPLQPLDLVRRLPPGFAAGAAWDTLTGWSRRPRGDSFAEVLRAGLGPTMCRRFYFPYARKLWGVEPEELDQEQARRRVSADSPGKLLARVARGAAARPAFFWYPRRGFGAISEALADAAAAEGAELRFRSSVERLELRRDGARVTLAGGETISARNAWSTIPLPALARMASPAPPRGVLAAAGRLELRAMALVYLSLETGRYTPYDAAYLPDAGTPVTRVSEPRNYRDSDDDPPDRTVLCAEIPCAAGDGLWRSGDEELARLVETALVERGLPPPRPRRMVVRRLPHAYPIYRSGYASSFEALDGWALQHPALLSFGRQGLFAHDNTHHALAMAWAATDALGAGGKLDRLAWAGARAGFARHVVED
jgi:protoporphyrinogen oxidase